MSSKDILRPWSLFSPSFSATMRWTLLSPTLPLWCTALQAQRNSGNQPWAESSETISQLIQPMANIAHSYRGKSWSEWSWDSIYEKGAGCLAVHSLSASPSQPHAGSPVFSVKAATEVRTGSHRGLCLQSLVFLTFSSLAREGSKGVKVTKPKSNALTASFRPKPTNLVRNLREGSFLCRTELYQCQSRILASSKCIKPSLLLQEKQVCFLTAKNTLTVYGKKDNLALEKTLLLCTYRCTPWYMQNTW